MGDETIQFASRFSNAVNQLALVGDDTQAQLRKVHDGAGLTAAIRRALDAVEAVYSTRTEAVRNWPEERRRVLAQLATMRKALDRSGVDGEVRRMARVLVEMIGPRSARRS